MMRRALALALAALAPLTTPAPVGAQETATVTLTAYTLTGTTYAGTQTRPGITACSWNFSLGTRFRLPDGRVVVCEDRGQLGNTGWLDVWMADDGAARRQGRTTVEVEILR